MRFCLEGRGKRRSERWGCKDFGASSLPRRWILWASGAPALTPLTQPVPHIILITLSPHFSFLYFVCFFRCLSLPPVFLHGLCTSFLTTLFLYTVSYHVSFLAFHYSHDFGSLSFSCYFVALPLFFSALCLSRSWFSPSLSSSSSVCLSTYLVFLASPWFFLAPHFLSCFLPSSAPLISLSFLLASSPSESCSSLYCTSLLVSQGSYSWSDLC